MSSGGGRRRDETVRRERAIQRTCMSPGACLRSKPASRAGEAHPGRSRPTQERRVDEAALHRAGRGSAGPACGRSSGDDDARRPRPAAASHRGRPPAHRRRPARSWLPPPERRRASFRSRRSRRCRGASRSSASSWWPAFTLSSTLPSRRSSSSRYRRAPDREFGHDGVVVGRHQSEPHRQHRPAAHSPSRTRLVGLEVAPLGAQVRGRVADHRRQIAAVAEDPQRLSPGRPPRPGLPAAAGGSPG